MQADDESLICPACGATRSNTFADCAECGWERVSAASDVPAQREFDAPILPDEMHPAARQSSCHCCGGRHFEWGSFYGARFVGSAGSWFAWFFTWWLFNWESTTRSRRCLTCGNIQLFTGVTADE